MTLAVLSGKGGTGKTFVSVNLAVTAGRATYIDCDVEAPNGHLFLSPTAEARTEISAKIPTFDLNRCVGCRQCADFCHFNALAFLRGKPKLFADVCHGCGGCVLLCPSGAITAGLHPVGTVERGVSGDLTVITGTLNLGEASGIPVIHGALKSGEDRNDVTILDCPPGSACSVMECVGAADCCLLVVEPTAFGLHNFQMVHELVTLLQKPCAVVINKSTAPYPPLVDFLREHHIKTLLELAYDPTLAEKTAVGQVAVQTDERLRTAFSALLEDIKGGACR